ncbi:hypothetical protein [Marinitoga aeolica]|uniref:Uncharacterized protein n=1 Tax=Marinitoga aeolica TaxID=2809031 RepID=A0ABY8PTM8_9BACT|nr:hypothetical protein [Marinitoga aeolica]WGS66011.1 hypothetical protein JRV97_05535 [Marinitoga aeolica]
MIYRFLISIMAIIFSIFLINSIPEDNSNKIIIPKYTISDVNNNYVNTAISAKELNEILSKLKSEKGVLIEHFKLKSNYDFFSNKSYSLYIKRAIPENTKLSKNYKKYDYKIFGFLNIDMNKLWENTLNMHNPEFFEFSGVIMKNSQKKAYIYFNGLLKEVSEGQKIGDYNVLKIFNDGILLYNEYEKRFEVLR